MAGINDPLHWPISHHGILILPASDSAPNGWGPPFDVNPPMGTVGAWPPCVLLRDTKIDRGIDPPTLGASMLDRFERAKNRRFYWEASRPSTGATMHRYFCVCQSSNIYLNGSQFCESPGDRNVQSVFSRSFGGDDYLCVICISEGVNGVSHRLYRRRWAASYDNNNYYDETSEPYGWEAYSDWMRSEPVKPTLGTPGGDTDKVKAGQGVYVNASGTEAATIIHLVKEDSPYYIFYPVGIMTITIGEAGATGAFEQTDAFLGQWTGDGTYYSSEPTTSVCPSNPDVDIDIGCNDLGVNVSKSSTHSRCVVGIDYAGDEKRELTCSIVETLADYETTVNRSAEVVWASDSCDIETHIVTATATTNSNEHHTRNFAVNSQPVVDISGTAEMVYQATTVDNRVASEVNHSGSQTASSRVPEELHLLYADMRNDLYVYYYQIEIGLVDSSAGAGKYEKYTTERGVVIKQAGEVVDIIKGDYYTEETGYFSASVNITCQAAQNYTQHDEHDAVMVTSNTIYQNPELGGNRVFFGAACNTRGESFIATFKQTGSASLPASAGQPPFIDSVEQDLTYSLTGDFESFLGMYGTHPRVTCVYPWSSGA